MLKDYLFVVGFKTYEPFVKGAILYTSKNRLVLVGVCFSGGTGSG